MLRRRDVVGLQGRAKRELQEVEDDGEQEEGKNVKKDNLKRRKASEVRETRAVCRLEWKIWNTHWRKQFAMAKKKKKKKKVSLCSVF